MILNNSFFLLFLLFPLLVQAQLIQVADVMTLPIDPPDQRIAYGPDSLQFGDLRIPEGEGPHPVVVILHGGCWLNAYDLYLMDPMATALTRAGYATWNLEYRRIGDEGGAWPGTFLDVAAGLNHLQEMAAAYALDLDRVLIAGHSAGGHLALWLAAQHRLPKDSELYFPDLLPVSGILSLAGITDPASYLVREGQACGSAVDELMGGLPEDLPLRYEQASPMALPASDLHQILITGTEDRIVPLTHIQPYVEKAKQQGNQIESIAIPAAGHFELIAPESVAWPEILRSIEALIGNE